MEREEDLDAGKEADGWYFVLGQSLIWPFHALGIEFTE
jgi:hypothetical protein